jgi:hypothetical protein
MRSLKRYRSVYGVIAIRLRSDCAECAQSMGCDCEAITQRLQSNIKAISKRLLTDCVANAILFDGDDELVA